MLHTAIRAAFVGVVSLAAAGAAHAEKLTVSHFGILINTLPEAVALEKGFWKQEGADIDGIIVAHGGGTSVRNLLASDLPMGAMALTAAIAANKQGIKLRIVADMSNTIGELVWATKKDSGLTKLSDLAGKKIAFTSPRSTTESIIKTVLKRHGLLGKVETLSTGGLGAGLTALDQGAVAAAPLVDPVLTKKAGQYNIVVRAAEELPDLSWAVIVTSEDYLKKNEDKVRRILAGRAKAVDYIYAHPEETAAIYAKYFKSTPADAKAMLPKFYTMRYWKRGEFNMKGFQTQVEGMELVGQLEAGYDVKPLLDTRFQAMLKEKK
ncbi:MAG: ABC transporter substrate-binding protein [Rhodospirillaceae bacterium]|nr:ABC transporter substrate-binding protein [Rhodospirillaceae bacterium]